MKDTHGWDGTTWTPEVGAKEGLAGWIRLGLKATMALRVLRTEKEPAQNLVEKLDEQDSKTCLLPIWRTAGLGLDSLCECVLILRRTSLSIS